MKKLILLLLVSTNLLGQQLQKTKDCAGNSEIWYSPKITNKVGKNQYVITQTDPITYYYNFGADSILVCPVYHYDSKTTRETVIGFNIWIPKEIDKVNSAEFKIWAVDRSKIQGKMNDVSFFFDMKKKIIKDKTTKSTGDFKSIPNIPFYSYLNPYNSGSVEIGKGHTGIFLELQEQELFTFDALFGTQEIELIINGHKLIPLQSRETNDYFELRRNLGFYGYKSFSVENGIIIPKDNFAKK